MTRTTLRPALRRRAPLVIAAGTALALMAGGTASAAVTSAVTGTTLLVAGDGADDRAAVTCVGGNVAVNGTALTPATACTTLTAINVSPGPGDDVVDLRSAVAPAFASSLTASVEAAAGQDQVFGGTSVIGGDGNDRFINGATGPSSITGGDGTDSAEYDFTGVDTTANYTITPSGLTAVVGGVSTPVTVSGVEQYVFSMPDGSATADVSTIDARTATTRIVARMHSGVDTFYGGSGNDYVDAGPGTDTVDPGAGNDSVQGGEGVDTINVRDGEVDVVDCGDGVDTVTADRGDVLKNCESTNLPPVPVVPTPAPETGGVVGLKRLPRGARASFVFVSPTSGAAFECRIDDKSWRSCRSPYKVRTSNLKVGKHKLYVRAVLSGGNVDASPSKFGFRITKPKPKPRKRR